MKNRLTAITGLFIILFIWLLSASGFSSEAPKATGLKEVILRVEGMTWGAWPLAVRKALEGLKGVKKTEVSFSEKQAVVTYEPEKVRVEDMIKAVSQAGFRATETPKKWGKWVANQPSLENKCFKTGLWGSIVAAICCFTPVLVIALGVAGLATIIPYLDYVLLPLLGIFLVLAFYGWWKRNQRS